MNFRKNFPFFLQIFNFTKKTYYFFQVLETRLVKRLWTESTKKMLSKDETSTRPCVKFVKAIPNDVWISSKICKRLCAAFKICKLLLQSSSKKFRQIDMIDDVFLKNNFWDLYFCAISTIKSNILSNQPYIIYKKKKKKQEED